MRLQDHIDFTTLQWVKPELDDTLSIAREALESYVDNPGKRDYMRTCADHLHQVHGTLRMVELYGAAMVTAEMEALTSALLDGKVEQREEAYAALMRGLMQLPDYLERLSSGHRDVPVVLLPLLNDLRAAHGQELLSESSMFHPNLDAFLPEQAPAAMSESYAEAHRGELADLRLRFQQQLLGWFRGQDASQQLVGMRKTLMAIAARCYHVHGRRLWWIAAGVLEGVEQGMVKGGAGEFRQLIGKVDRNIRLLIEHGENSLRAGDADEVACKLLFIVAQAKQRSPHMELLRKTYSLDSLLPDSNELEHARGSMAGHNRALLDSVSRAIKDDLLRVKEALDLFLRQPNGDPAQLAPEGEVLERVGDTLGMLALAVPRRVVAEQRRVLDEIVNRMRPADEDTLLDVAGALLYVEASLDDHIESLGSDDESASDGKMAHGLPRSEALGVVTTLMQEAIGNTGRVKDAIVAFVESGWEHDRLAGTPALMDEVAGAMRMLSANRPAELAEGVGRFVGYELLEDHRVPSGVQMDHLADALAALEYYLEAAREHRGGLEHILDVAEHSLGLLGYWPVPAVREVGATTTAGTDTMAIDQPGIGDEQHPELNESVSLAAGGDLVDLIVGSSEATPTQAQDIAGLHLASTEPAAVQTAEFVSGGDVPDGWIEIEEEIVEHVPLRDPLAANTTFNIDADGIDDDIREIFLEEMQEEIDNLLNAEKTWLGDPSQKPALVNIRRSFHTLKGSGRLVGAGVLGEFAWKVEDMLNRVLDGSIQPHAGVQDLVRRAIDALPQFLNALKGEGEPHAPISAIMQTADKLSAGEQAQVEDFITGETETVRHIVRKRVPAADAVPQADVTDAISAVGADDKLEVEPEPEPEPEHALVMPILPPVDPVLLEILRSEVAQYLQTIRASIQRCDDELTIGEDLLRAVHTLHGAIAMVDIPLLTQLLSPLEGLVKRLRASNEPLSVYGVRLLGQSADLVDYVMAQFDVAEPQLPDADELTAQVIALRDGYPESKVPSDIFHEDDEGITPPEQMDQDVIMASLNDSVEQAEESQSIDAEDEPASDTDLTPEASSEDADHAANMAEFLGTLEQFDPQASLDAEAAVAKLAAEQAEAERIAAEQAAAEKLIAEQVEAERISAEQAAAEKLAAEQAEAELVAAEQAAAEKFVAEQAEAERVAAEQAAADKLAAEQAEAEWVAFEQAAAEKLAAEQAEVERVAAERAAEKLAAEQAEREAVQQAAQAAAAENTVRAGAAPAPVVDQTASNELGQIDADLLEVFIDEAREILDHADGVLAHWHDEPSELTHVAELQRDLHTLKGGARIAGLAAVGDLSHAIETLLEKPIKDVQKTALLITALEANFDLLHSMVQQVAQGQVPDYPQASIDQLLALAGEETFTDDAMLAAAATLESTQAATVQESAKTDNDQQWSQVSDLPELLPEMEQEVRSSQEQIRVRADLLDNLVNHAGEVAIYRSRLEQQVAGYRFNLVELEQTVARLRSQLRMLEIETEAQIIARFQREHREAGMTTFDPLELDRYSQLQQYSRALAESVSDLVSIQSMLDELTRQAETLLIQQSRVSTELQDGLLRTRMLPFDTMVPNLRRTLRQAAQEQGKSAQLYVEGAHGEMDRNLLDRIKAPFEHMLRNAIAHGIESPADRRKAGKPAEGAVHIHVAREATEVVVRVSDDGRGLNRAMIRERGIERGLLRADIKPSDNQLLSLITQPGFSTASKVTQLAGRGVGMDVVANEIKQLGGSLSIESEEGKGSTFILRLPFTLAVTQAILVRIGEATFAIPMTSVQGVARVNPEDLATLLAEDEPTFRYGLEEYGIHDLAELLGLPPGLPAEGEQQPLLLTRAGDLRAAIRIDAVIGSREIVVKSVGPQISSVPGLLGATIMGDGAVLIILDLAPLVRHGITRRQQRLADGLSAVQAPIIEEVRVNPLVMVVDDSITMRKVTGRVLERHEYEVSTAKDGIDAIEKLHERVPDMMLLDIEMPRMDGYELATHMKADPRLRDVPIIMITSRSGDKHRQRAFDIGVDRYLGKPYQEAELLAQIAEVLEQRALESSND